MTDTNKPEPFSADEIERYRQYFAAWKGPFGSIRRRETERFLATIDAQQAEIDRLNEQIDRLKYQLDAKDGLCVPHRAEHE